MKFSEISSNLSDIKLVEAATSKEDKLTLIKLPYSDTDLEPVISKETIKYHYNILSKGYIEKYNKREGDIDFQYAGAKLHCFYWPQFQKPKNTNKPTGSSLEFIEKHFKSFDSFREEFEGIANKIEGSGWTYLAKDGSIKVIKNHAWKTDIILLIDYWEHATNPYEARKDAVAQMWKIINWEFINTRL